MPGGTTAASGLSPSPAMRSPSQPKLGPGPVASSSGGRPMGNVPTTEVVPVAKRCGSRGEGGRPAHVRCHVHRSRRPAGHATDLVVTAWLIDKSGLARLGRSRDAKHWATRIDRGLVRVCAVTRLEVGPQPGRSTICGPARAAHPWPACPSGTSPPRSKTAPWKSKSCSPNVVSTDRQPSQTCC